MKHALVAVALLFSCSINKKSGEYACSTTADCNTGRVCLSGFCVVSGDGGIGIDDASLPGTDGSMPPLDGAPIDAPMTACPPACASCDVDGKTCDIECDSASCSHVTCPPGYDCTINCSGNTSCSSGVDCTNATACTITCSGSASCGDVECGSGSCDITCTGRRSCGVVDCGDSCACDLSCTGSNACRGSSTGGGGMGGGGMGGGGMGGGSGGFGSGGFGSNITCGHNGQCIGFGAGERCTSSYPGCNTCP